MRNKHKLIAARDRSRNLELREQERLSLAESARELKTRVAGFSKSAMSKDQVAELKRKLRDRAAREKFGARYDVTSSFAKAKPDGLPKTKERKYVGEMAAREKLALEKTKELQARTGQVGNKMGLQYLTDSDLADMRKGLLRRRS